VHISVAQLGGAALVDRLGLRRLVPIAVDRAVVDIIEPVVNRSVTIACTATAELIVKDFAVEQDEQCMRKAAHLMVSSLAGQLALVTCREPMRVSLLEMLRSLLQPALEPVALEHAATARAPNHTPAHARRLPSDHQSSARPCLSMAWPQLR